MNKLHSLVILPILAILVWNGCQISTVAAPEQPAASPQGVESQTGKTNLNSRDISTLEKALLGRWVSEPLPGKDIRLTYYFSAPDVWLTGQLLDGKSVPGGALKYKVIKVNEKENSLRIQYLLNTASDPLEATVIFSPDRQSLNILFLANGIYVPSVRPFRYDGNLPSASPSSAPSSPSPAPVRIP